MTWKNAQKYCREHHDDLSTVNKEQALQLSSNPENKNAYFWIGLHMIFNNLENWSWSGGEDQKTDYWDIQESNNAVEKCGCVSRHTAKLHNAMCIHYFPFYCMEVFKPILVHQNKTWDESLNYCWQNYIDLVSLSSQINMEEVINNTITSQTAYVWTGLRFMVGHWFWVSGDNLQYKAWSTVGEPQCPARNLHCGTLDRRRNIWQPKDCEEKLNFVCLMKP
ncbi:lymphocyte antigen 75-like [Sinocyclocheilus rhinocerous]|uniref:lymphocyte antigen 75-like n=1 Tax=Sinocyclocheilus rhinocerous TaxID=307959 RepID=UPI0007B82AC2|nr:PREDICTED: lymphocyte antigen 75-like [Sinocyclocheilus rhinocerous]